MLLLLLLIAEVKVKVDVVVEVTVDGIDVEEGEAGGDGEPKEGLKRGDETLMGKGLAEIQVSEAEAAME